MHLAVEMNDLRIIDLLLQQKEIDVSIVDEILIRDKSSLDFILDDFYISLCKKPIEYCTDENSQKLFNL